MNQASLKKKDVGSLELGGIVMSAMGKKGSAALLSIRRLQSINTFIQLFADSAGFRRIPPDH